MPLSAIYFNFRDKARSSEYPNIVYYDGFLYETKTPQVTASTGVGQLCAVKTTTTQVKNYMTTPPAILENTFEMTELQRVNITTYVYYDN